MSNLKLMDYDNKISDAVEPDEILLLLGTLGQEKLRVQDGDLIKTGQRLAEHIISPVTGMVERFETIKRVFGDEQALRVTNLKEEELDPDLESVSDFTKIKPIEIIKKLNRGNLDIQLLSDEIKNIIVSGIDQEPLLGINQQLMRENKIKIVHCLKLIQHLTSPQKIILTIPSSLYESMRDLGGDKIDVVDIKPIYPNGLPFILAKNLEKKYQENTFHYISIEKLLAAIDILKTGKSITHKLITVTHQDKSTNLRVRIGTLLKDIIKDSDPGKVIINGPMGGYAGLNLITPITKSINSIYIQEKESVVLNKNNQCINCGECVRACPLNLDVNLICRYSEFSMFEKSLKIGGDDCMECGLCAYHCPAGRSLVQMIKLAKKEGSISKGESDL